MNEQARLRVEAACRLLEHADDGELEPAEAIRGALGLLRRVPDFDEAA